MASDGLELPPRHCLTEGDCGEDAFCVVCHGCLQAGTWTRLLPCSHSCWHEDCIVRWLQEQHTCPICRAEVPGLPDLVTESELVVEAARLRTARNRLASRMAELEDERRLLELQVRRIGSELESFRAQLLQLHSEREELCAGLRLHRLAMVSTGREGDSNDVSDGSDFEEGRDTEPNEKAKEILERLRGALLRAPLPAVEAFQALSCGTGRLSHGQAWRLLRSLEASAPEDVLARAFVLLDVNVSGFIEEADWMTALRLPRYEVLRSAGGSGSSWISRFLSRQSLHAATVTTPS